MPGPSAPFDTLTLLDAQGAQVSLGELCAASPTLWVFLRHFG